MPTRPRPLTPAQLALLTAVANAADGYVAKNMTEYRRLLALARRGLIEAASWRASYAGQTMLDASKGVDEPHEVTPRIRMEELSAVDHARLVAAAGILLDAWEQSDPVLAGIFDLMRTSGMPRDALFREHPDLLNMLATQLAMRAAKSDDDVPRIVNKQRKRLLTRFKETEADKAKRSPTKE